MVVVLVESSKVYARILLPKEQVIFPYGPTSELSFLSHSFDPKYSNRGKGPEEKKAKVALVVVEVIVILLALLCGFVWAHILYRYLSSTTQKSCCANPFPRQLTKIRGSSFGLENWKLCAKNTSQQSPYIVPSKVVYHINCNQAASSNSIASEFCFRPTLWRKPSLRLRSFQKKEEEEEERGTTRYSGLLANYHH